RQVWRGLLRQGSQGSFIFVRECRCLGLPFGGVDIIHTRLRQAAQDRERFVYSAGPTVVGIADFALGYPDSDEEILTDSSPDSLRGCYCTARSVAGRYVVITSAF